MADREYCRLYSENHYRHFLGPCTYSAYIRLILCCWKPRLLQVRKILKIRLHNEIWVIKFRDTERAELQFPSFYVSRFLVPMLISFFIYCFDFLAVFSCKKANQNNKCKKKSCKKDLPRTGNRVFVFTTFTNDVYLHAEIRVSFPCVHAFFLFLFFFSFTLEKIKSNLLLYSLYYAETCNELAGPTSASLRPDNTVSSKKYRCGGEP